VLDDVDLEGDDGDAGGSWFSRTTGGVRSLGSGLLFLGALFVLFWNEGYSKRHGDALIEVAQQVQPAPPTAISPALEGKPIHLSARVNSQAGARDDVFGIRTDGVALYRYVEMFQWIEYEESSGRGRKKKTTYHYEQDWSNEYQDSSQFHEPAGHENPKPALSSDSFFAADARFGPYRFNNRDVADQALDDMYDPDALGSLGKWPALVEDLPELSSALTAKRWYQLEPGVYYRGNQASEEAQLGDLSVSFYRFANDYPLTMIGAQQGEFIVPWRASSGDTILLASGGSRGAKDLIKQAQAESAGFTHILRVGGLICAVMGAAGIASWLGSFLSMIPVVGRLVTVSLSIAGGLFGLIAGLVTIVVGWLAARPWIAALLLIAIGSAVTWAIKKRREADGVARRAARAGKLAEAARQRAAQVLQAATPAAPMALATAAAAGSAPPPPPGAARFAATDPHPPRLAAPPPPPPPAVVDDSKELPPLEWTPGLISTKPPAVRPQTAPAPAAAPASVPAPAPKVVAAERVPERPARPAAPPPDIPGFDSVPLREPAQPLFDQVPLRETTAPLFDTVPLREPETPLMFDLASMAEESPPPVAAPPPPEPKMVRIALGSKGDYSLNKIVRQHADGKQETVCFELSRGGKPIKRGSQDEVKEALRLALSGG